MSLVKIPGVANYRRLTRRAARRYGLDPYIFQRQIGRESVNFDPAVITGRRSSPAGAQGIAQFMPATARGLGVDPLKPKQALDAAAKLMAGYVRKYGSYEAALRAYNAGPGAIKQSHGYSETNNYVAAILHGRDPKRLGVRQRGAGARPRGVSGTPGTPGSVGAQNLPMGSTGALDALAALAQQPASPPPSALPAPSFAAAPVLPKGYQPVQSGGGPEPKVDVNSLLEQIRTPGGDVQLAPGVPGTAGTPGALGTQGLTTGRGTGGGKGDAFVAAVRQEAQHISQAKVPYSWGGGHGRPQKAGSKVTPLDCSGAVSRVLGVNPRVSGEFEKWGKPGHGRVTVYANKTHVLMEIDGHFWGTSASNPGGGAGWIPRSKISADYLRNFTARHA